MLIEQYCPLILNDYDVSTTAGSPELRTVPGPIIDKQIQSCILFMIYCIIIIVGVNRRMLIESASYVVLKSYIKLKDNVGKFKCIDKRSKFSMCFCVDGSMQR